MQNILARIGECEFCGSTQRLIQIRVYKVKYFCCLECNDEMIALMFAEYDWQKHLMEKND